MSTSRSKKQRAVKQQEPKGKRKHKNGESLKASKTAQQSDAALPQLLLQATVEEKVQDCVSQGIKAGLACADTADGGKEPKYASFYGHNGRFVADPATGFTKWVFTMESGPEPNKIEDACGVGEHQSHPFEKLHGPPIQIGICEVIAGTVIERLKWEVKLLT